jgi:hypothetical protein
MLMTAGTKLTARRATVEDLPQLISLWKLEQLPSEMLEKRFTEFQVVSDDAGQVVAGIGMQISGSQGLLHSESIGQPEIGDHLRTLLWNRMQAIIQNHALERLWTTLNFPFWRELGFESATPEQIAAVPGAFANQPGHWRVKALRAADANAAIEKEFARLKVLQQEESARLKDRTRLLKRIAMGMVVVVFILVMIWAVTLLKLGPRILPPR